MSVKVTLNVIKSHFKAVVKPLKCKCDVYYLNYLN